MKPFRLIGIVFLWLASASLALLPAQFVQHRRKAFQVAPPSGYLINEDFEGTGYDNSNENGWVEVSGDTLENYTTNVAKGSQSLALAISGGAAGEVYATFASGTTMYAFARVYLVAHNSIQGMAIVSLRNSTTTMVGFGVDGTEGLSTTQVKIFADGAYSSASATRLSLGTWYYVWIKFVSGGECYVAVSSTSTRPTVDGSGNVYLTKTAASGSVDRIRLSHQGTIVSGQTVLDNVLVSTTEIGNNPEP